MQYLITLELQAPQASLNFVKQLPGLQAVEIDEAYGLVSISPKRNLYVIRVSGTLDPQQLMALQPEVKGVHSDTRIEPFSNPP